MHLLRLWTSVLLFAAVSGLQTSATAQTKEQSVSSISELKLRLPTGATVYVTARNGRRVKGTLVETTDDAIRIRSREVLRTISFDEIRQIDEPKQDGLLNGILIGAGIGAMPGIYWLIKDPNECTGMCPEELALVGLGAVAGSVIDYLIRKKVTVYRSGPQRERLPRVSIGPWLTRQAPGMRVIVSF